MKIISRSRSVILGSLSLLVGCVMLLASSPASALGPFRIKTADWPYRCMDVRDVSQYNGAYLQIYDCLPYQYNQQFNIYPVGTYVGGTGYNIVAAHSGKCLDVKDVSMAAGAPIQQWDCLGAYQTNQVFRMVNHYGSLIQYEAIHSGKCIQFVGNYNLSQLTQSPYSCDQLYQAWNNKGWNDVE